MKDLREKQEVSGIKPWNKGVKMSCPNCDTCDESWSVPTEDDPEIIIHCNNCGAEWAEPNELYLIAKKRKVEELYYKRFGR